MPRESSAVVRYPDPDVLILDPRFQKIFIGNAGIRRIATGFDFTEGPVWFGDGRYLLFSDIPNDKILRWDETTGRTSVFRSPSNYANGNTRDRHDGNVADNGRPESVAPGAGPALGRSRRIPGLPAVFSLGARGRCGLAARPGGGSALGRAVRTAMSTRERKAVPRRASKAEKR